MSISFGNRQDGKPIISRNDIQAIDDQTFKRNYCIFRNAEIDSRKFDEHYIEELQSFNVWKKSNEFAI